MQVTTARNGVEAVVTIVGDVDAETSPRLEEEVNSLLVAGARTLVVDADGVTFLGSSGLSVLLGAHRSAEQFVLRRGNRIVDRLVTLTGLEFLYGEATIAE